MAELMFGLGGGHLTARAAKIAKSYGATLVNYTDPGCTCGYGCGRYKCPANRRHWFTGRNRGAPFDGQLSARVLEALAAGKALTPKK